VTARALPEQLHGTADPTPEQHAIALQRVRADPNGSTWLAAQIPGRVLEGREDPRAARARAVYLGR
jgi:hypothetical protein